jgi:hypothetical protein
MGWFHPRPAVSEVAGTVSSVNTLQDGPLLRFADWPSGDVPVPPEYSIGRLTCRYWQPAWRCDGWLAGCP